MLYREIIAVYSQIHTKHINTLCGQNVELLNVKLAVHSDHWDLESYVVDITPVSATCYPPHYVPVAKVADLLYMVIGTAAGFEVSSCFTRTMQQTQHFLNTRFGAL
jgi:hypothetical protein